METRHLIIGAVVILAVCAALALGATGQFSAPSSGVQDRDVIFQVSTIGDLLEGGYDGLVSIKTLKSRGDVAIGTMDRLEGELIAIGGAYYAVKADGAAYPLPDYETTPFAVATFLDADLAMPVKSIANISELEDYLARQMPSRNVFCAIRIDGTYPYVKTRSLPSQDPPYPRLVDVVEHQSVFEFHDARGSVVGFWTPECASGLNIPGLHLHFITSGRDAGGHVLELSIGEAEAVLDPSPEFFMVLSPAPGNASSVTGRDISGEIEKIEK